MNAEHLFVIACDKRDDSSTTLFMVDRRIQRASFWSDRLDDVFIYNLRGAAERKAKALRFNSPRVLSLAEARIISAMNPCAQKEYDKAEDSYDLSCIGHYEDNHPEGWDDHKSWI